MPSSVAPGDVRHLVEEVLRVGLILSDLVAILVEDLPEDAFPGEEPGEVLVQMLAGSMQPVADAAGTETVEGAIALVGAMLDRAIADLRRAAELAGPR